MKINLTPQRRETELSLNKSGDVLTFNGEAFDFSALPVGATLPAEAITSDWIIGDVVRDDTGELILTVVLPHTHNAPEETKFPTPLEDVADGDIALPFFGTITPPFPEEDPIEEPA